MEKISVIVPIFNVEEFLSECLESIVNQTYKNLEVILIDDGSTDQSGAICDQWGEKDDRFIIIHKINEGISIARNTGLKICTGDYIAFCDSDDIIDKTMLSTMYEGIVKNDADMAMCHEYAFNSLSELDSIPTVDTKYKECEDRDVFMQHFLDNFTAGLTRIWNKLYTRELIGNLQFKEGIIIEDRRFIIDVFQKLKKCAVVPKRMYFYRQHDKSVMHSDSRKVYHDHCQVTIYEYKALTNLGMNNFNELHLYKCLNCIADLSKRARKEGYIDLSDEIVKSFDDLYDSEKKSILQFNMKMKFLIIRYLKKIYYTLT